MSLASHLRERRRIHAPRLTVARRGAASLAGAAFALVLGLACTGAALAHDQPYSHVEVRVVPGSLAGRVVAHVVDLAHEANLPVPDSLFDAAYLDTHEAELRTVLDQRVHLLAGGRRVRPVWGASAAVPERRSIGFEWSATAENPGSITLDGPLFPYDPPHETYFNVFEGDSLRHQAIVDRAHASSTWYHGGIQGTFAVVRTFVLQGVHHIFIGPDHILFIIGLLLLGGSLLRLLKIVTAFTIAHSITLVLATLGIVQPPARVVEPVIALSIVYVGIETLFAMRHPRDWRGRIAFLFGFVHGFGFAGVLREFGLPAGALGWSLASFNVGVEIGQACIVLAVAPPLALLRTRRPALAPRVVTIGAIGIITAGAWWFVERVWFAR